MTSENKNKHKETFSEENTSKGDMNIMNDMNVLSKVFDDNVMMESVFEKDETSPRLLVKECDGKIVICDNYEKGDDKFFPQCNDTILERIVRLPYLIEIHEVEPSRLLKEITQFIKEYIELDEIKYEIISRYVLMTWVYERFDRIPYLRIIGQYGTGKSKLLEVLYEITYHSSKLGVGITHANIYRWLDSYPGTLLLDEIDFRYTQSTNQITKILNGGYQRGSHVTRSRPTIGGYVQERFNNFGPKILAGRSLFDDDALESRVISVNSQELTREDIPRYLPDRNKWEEPLYLRNELLNFRLSFFNRLNPNEEIPGLEKYEPRLCELLAPLILVTGDNKMTEDIERIANQINLDRRAINSLGIEGKVAQSICALCDGEYTPTVGDIANHANATRIGQAPTSPRRIGSIIRGFGIETRRTANGFVINPNINQLQSLARRYGIDID